jgi:hypothetical protein
MLLVEDAIYGSIRLYDYKVAGQDFSARGAGSAGDKDVAGGRAIGAEPMRPL